VEEYDRKLMALSFVDLKGEGIGPCESWIHFHEKYFVCVFIYYKVKTKNSFKIDLFIEKVAESLRISVYLPTDLSFNHFILEIRLSDLVSAISSSISSKLRMAHEI
jgi:hypothetical protein